MFVWGFRSRLTDASHSRSSLLSVVDCFLFITAHTIQIVMFEITEIVDRVWIVDLLCASFVRKEKVLTWNRYSHCANHLLMLWTRDSLSSCSEVGSTRSCCLYGCIHDMLTNERRLEDDKKKRKNLCTYQISPRRYPLFGHHHLSY